MTRTELLHTERDGAVQVIRMVNDRTRNSLNNEMRIELSAALTRAADDDAVRAIYLTGSGKAFCSGGDLHNLKSLTGPWQVHRRFRNLGKWLLPLLHLDKPVVVGVNGVAVGGGMGLALTGDVLIAAESAKFMAGFFRLGIVPDVGMMYTLPRLIGLARAKNFLFSNGTWTAQEALELGLVAQVVADSDMDAVALARAHEIAEGPAQGMGLAKLLMARSFESSLAEMFLLEDLGQSLAMSGEEFSEGLDALLEKRSPDFTRGRKR